MESYVCPFAREKTPLSQPRCCFCWIFISNFQEVLMAQKFRDAIKCTNSLKPRYKYAYSKFNYDQVAAIHCVKDAVVYICWAVLLNEKSLFHSSIVARRLPSCTFSPMEATYYSIKPSRLPEVCYHCGSENQLANNNAIKDLKSLFTKVWPICCICFSARKKPTKWGPNNNPKRKKVSKFIKDIMKTLHHDVSTIPLYFELMKNIGMFQLSLIFILMTISFHFGYCWVFLYQQNRFVFFFMFSYHRLKVLKKRSHVFSFLAYFYKLLAYFFVKTFCMKQYHLMLCCF